MIRVCRRPSLSVDALGLGVARRPSHRLRSATRVGAHVFAQLTLPVLQARIEHAELDDGRRIGLAKALAPALGAVDGAGQVAFRRGGLGLGGSGFGREALGLGGFFRSAGRGFRFGGDTGGFFGRE